jgi:hypothetical protein
MHKIHVHGNGLVRAQFTDPSTMNMKNMMGNIGKIQAALKNFEIVGRYVAELKPHYVK